MTTYWFEYGKVGNFESKTTATAVGSDNTWHWESNNVSLKSCTEYQARIVVENEDSKKTDPGGVVVGATETFKTECWPPSVKSKPAQEVKRTSGVMEGEVYPNGIPTKYWFEYGKKGSFESKTTPTEAGSAKSWYPEHATYGSIEPCKEYQFRIVAENEDALNGPPKGPLYGETEYFTTRCKPLIQNVKVSHLESGSVVLEAEVNPEEAETKYHFEYDTREYKQGEAAHGTSVPLPEPSAGSGTSFVKVSIAVVKLIPGQRYYFNVRTHNESGPTTKEESFKTPVDWELNGKVLAAGSPVALEGAVMIQNTECSLKGEGTAGGEGGGEISKVTGLKAKVS